MKLETDPVTRKPRRVCDEHPPPKPVEWWVVLRKRPAVAPFKTTARTAFEAKRTASVAFGVHPSELEATQDAPKLELVK